MATATMTAEDAELRQQWRRARRREKEAKDSNAGTGGKEEPAEQGRTKERGGREKEGQEGKERSRRKSKSRKKKKKDGLSGDEEEGKLDRTSRSRSSKRGEKGKLDRSSRSRSSKEDGGQLVVANGGGGGGGKGGGVTVSQFRDRQQSLQDEASSRRNNSLRQRTLREQRERAGPQDDYGDVAPHRYDEDSDDDQVAKAKRGSLVVRDSDRPADRAGAAGSRRLGDTQSGDPIVDAVPADHPSSSVVQTHRTCSLCRQTKPRSQFSERDRFSVHPSLSPGATCRTCTMTVCAAKLKSMPDTAQLLAEYAARANRQGLLTGGAPVAGYLEMSGEQRGGGYNDSALVVRRDSQGDISGSELAIYHGSSLANDHHPRSAVPGTDVNAAFYGKSYGETDEDRPDRVADCRYVDALLRMPCYLNLNAFGLFTSTEDISLSLAALEAVRLYGTLDEGFFVPHDCDGNPVPEVRKGGPGGRRRRKASERTADADAEHKNPRGVVCLVLGEGASPRTSVLASQHYGWTALAVDPLLSEDWDGCHDDVSGFTGYSSDINEFTRGAGESMVEFRHQSVEHLVIIAIQSETDAVRLKGKGHVEEIRGKYDDVPTTLVSISPVRKATLAPSRKALEGRCGSKLERDVGYEPNCAYVDEGVFSRRRFVEIWNFHNEDGDEEEEDDCDEGEGGYDGGPYRRTSTGEESDYVKSKGGGRALEGAKRSGENAGREKQKRSDEKRSGEQRLGWLEDRVEKFKREKDWGGPVGVVDVAETTDEAGRPEGVMVRGDPDFEDSMSTLGMGHMMESMESLETKETYEPPREEEEEEEEEVGEGEEDREAEQEDEDATAKAGRLSDATEAKKAWSAPDEERAGEVWEKALAKHDEQESLCDQFEDYYRGDSGGAQEEDAERIDGGNEGPKDQQIDDRAVSSHSLDLGASETSLDHRRAHNLPPGWEAIQDQDSGDFYYNNYETGEVTWDHPLGNDPATAASADGGGPSGGGTSEAANAGDEAEDDREYGGVRRATTDSAGSFVTEPPQRPAAGTTAPDLAGDDDADDASPTPGSQYQEPKQELRRSKVYEESESDLSQSQTYVCGDDDDSTGSSGIAVLTRWNQQAGSGGAADGDRGQANSGGGGGPNGPEEDMIAWSDDECDDAGKDGDDGLGELRSLRRSESQKRQPWHKRDSEEGNNDSFLYD
ncbi:hypothetical protein ACHAWF_013794 [Thalassiosira exigua]